MRLVAEEGVADSGLLTLESLRVGVPKRVVKSDFAQQQLAQRIRVLRLASAGRKLTLPSTSPQSTFYGSAASGCRPPARGARAGATVTAGADKTSRKNQNSAFSTLNTGARS